MTDLLGYRKLIGIVVPSTNTSVQPECDGLRVPGVTNHIARVTTPERKLGSDAAYQAHLQAMREGIEPALDQVMTAQPDHIVMGVAIEAFSGGVAHADQFQESLVNHCGVGVSMGSTAAVRALRAFSASRIAVLTPHQPAGDEIVRNYLEDAGFEVVRLKGLRCPSPRMIAHVTPADIRASLQEINGDDVDAILQVGTNLAAGAIAADAERWLGKPVLSMNVVTYWDALRQLGIDDRILGSGRIFEEC
jgi:maleate isomerase